MRIMEKDKIILRENEFYVKRINDQLRESDHLR